LYADDKSSDDTPKAAQARKLLKQKTSVEFQDTRLEDALDEIKEQVKGLVFRLDTKGGVSRNQTINFKAEGKPVAEILDGMFKKNGLGYVVISGKNNAYDGSILIKQGKERGYPTK
jgi:autotransporter-associated beta strand protein